MAKYWAEINNSNEVIETTVFQDDVTTAEKAAAVKPLADSNNQYVEYFLDGGSRKIRASIGYTYDSSNDAFVEPKPSESFTYNTSTGKWDEPSGKPEGYSYWDEDANTWQTV
mgnify:FL=1|jgi:hypothetical protein|tara:strand:+ start:210 stop:545 length:336 start_codon:yes stop_codon:yes gene_type:complete